MASQPLPSNYTLSTSASILPSRSRSPIQPSPSRVSSPQYISNSHPGSQHFAQSVPTTSKSHASPRCPYVVSSVPPIPIGFGTPPGPDDVEVKHYWGGTPALNPTAVGNGSPTLPHEWVRFIHLDGSMYYCNIMSVIVTPADISHPETFAKLQAVLPKLMRQLSEVPPHLATQHVIVIEDLDNKDGPTIYTLDYENCRYMRFVEKDSAQQVHVEERTEKFWAALEAYPMHLQVVPRNIEVDFLGALSFGASERILEWNETSFPFTDEQTRRLVQIHRELKTAYDKGASVAPSLTWHIARTMAKIEQARQKAKFGTPDFQLYRDVVPEEVGWKVKLADACLLFFLFGAHRMYRMRLQSARVKGVVYLADFRELLGNFLAEWSDSNLLATVFVGANIAFLAVPDITSLQQTASLSSTIFSILSVATGVHHTWQHRTKINASYEEACKYMSHSSSDSAHDTDLAITACFLSIPLVSLLYAVLSFSIALGAFCIQSTETHGRILLAVVLGILGTAGFGTLLFFWHVWRGPRSEEVSEEDVWDVVAYGWGTRIGKVKISIGEVVTLWAKVTGEVRQRLRRTAKKGDAEQKV